MKHKIIAAFMAVLLVASLGIGTVSAAEVEDELGDVDYSDYESDNGEAPQSIHIEFETENDGFENGDIATIELQYDTESMEVDRELLNAENPDEDRFAVNLSKIEEGLEGYDPETDILTIAIQDTDDADEFIDVNFAGDITTQFDADDSTESVELSVEAENEEEDFVVVVSNEAGEIVYEETEEDLTDSTTFLINGSDLANESHSASLFADETDGFGILGQNVNEFSSVVNSDDGDDVASGVDGESIIDELTAQHYGIPLFGYLAFVGLVVGFWMKVSE